MSLTTAEVNGSKKARLRRANAMTTNARVGPPYIKISARRRRVERAIQVLQPISPDGAFGQNVGRVGTPKVGRVKGVKKPYFRNGITCEINPCAEMNLTFRGPDQLAFRSHSGRGKEDIHPIALLRLLVEEGLLLLLLLLFLARGLQKKVSRSKFQKYVNYATYPKGAVSAGV